MKFRRNPRFTASLLIFMMNIFVSRTLTCHRTEYVFGNECCPMCPIGHRVKTDCEVDKSTSCQPCTEGTFMNKLNGLKSCFPCSECGSAPGLKMKTSCEILSDTVCEPLEGFYCSDFRKDDCYEAKKHRRCDPGEYISQRGTSSTDTVCSTCSDGTFSDGTFTSCQNHKQCESEGRELLRTGTESEDAQCGGLLSYRTGLIVGVVVGAVISSFITLGERLKSEESSLKRMELIEQIQIMMKSEESKPKESAVETGQRESSPGSCSGPAAGP
ncbi:tumor necrosis factor receptor superfamily member 14-like [Tautogolabrus adspersus]